MKDIAPNVDSRALYDPYVFRDLHCYSQDVCEVLQQWEKELKAKESNRKRREAHTQEVAKIEERKRLAQRAEKKRKYAQEGMAAMREAKKSRGE